MSYANNYPRVNYWDQLYAKSTTITASVTNGIWANTGSTTASSSGNTGTVRWWLSPCDCTWDVIEIGGTEHRVRVSAECPYCAYDEYKKDLVDVLRSLGAS